MNRFDRLLGILLHLRAGQRLAAADLARRFEVSPRTIYRDVDVLSALGVPVYAERGRAGGLRLLPGYMLPPIMFSTEEAISLVVGLTWLRGLRSSPFAAARESAARKLLAAVPDDLRATMAAADRLIGFEAALADAFHPEPAPAGVALPAMSDASAEAGVLDIFLQAVLAGRCVLLRYRSPYRSSAVDLTITPHGLFWDRDRWYLAGQTDGSSRTPHLWRADRVVAIAPGAAARPAPTFDVRDLLGRAWLQTAMDEWAREAPVRVRLTPRLAARLGRDWYYRHADFAPLPDGRVMMTFGEDDQAAVLDLLRWLGPEAELIEPASWRAALRAELAQMLDTYAGEGREPS
jgi:predicted DNA-binding transcriptional regulator YafY